MYEDFCIPSKCPSQEVKTVSRKTPRIFTPINSLKELYTNGGNTFGDKVAFRYYAKDGSIDTLTYSQLRHRIERIAAGLDSVGLAGKRVAVIGESSPDWIATYIAVVSTGGIIIPLDKELLLNEISNFLNRSEADALVFSRSFNKKFEQFSCGTATVQHFIAMDPDGFEFPGEKPVLSLLDLIEDGQRRLCQHGYVLPEGTDREKMCCMLFTSGTTGTSKCVMLSEKNICSCVNSCCATVDFNSSDVVVSVLPLHHTYELACTLAELTYGIEICINDSLKKVVKNLAVFKPTGLVLVPLFVSTIYKKIRDEAKKKGRSEMLRRGIAVANVTRAFGLDISRNLFKDVLDVFGGRLTKIVCGGAPMDPTMVKALPPSALPLWKAMA